MKALVICSVHAVCDLASIERKAANAAFAQHHIPAILTVKDHARIVQTTTVLEVIDHLPGTEAQRSALRDTFIDTLNDMLWDAAVTAYDSVHGALLDPNAFGRRTAFVSEYPQLTTNLVRASALMTNATRLGTVVTPSGSGVRSPIAEGLRATVESLNCRPEDIDVLVARRTDFATARALGMNARFVDEIGVTAAPTLLEAEPVSMPENTVYAVPGLGGGAAASFEFAQSA